MITIKKIIPVITLQLVNLIALYERIVRNTEALKKICISFFCIRITSIWIYFCELLALLEHLEGKPGKISIDPVGEQMRRIRLQNTDRWFSSNHFPDQS